MSDPGTRVWVSLPWMRAAEDQPGDGWYLGSDYLWARIRRPPDYGAQAAAGTPYVLTVAEDGSWVWAIGGGGSGSGGRWEPLTNGDPENPEILFANGDVLMTFVEV